MNKFKVPSKVSKNAKLALEWGDKYGRGIAMTEVGWKRAEQLANESEVGLETIKKMSAFNRHRKNSKISPDLKDTPWLDRGYVAWLGWGGTEGVDWAMEISKQFSDKQSTYTEQFRKKYGEAFDKAESKEKSERDNFTDKVSQVTKIDKEILDQVYDKGIGAAASAGMRSNVSSPDQWAKARVYSFVMKGRTYETADKSLADEVRKKIKNFSEKNKKVKLNYLGKNFDATNLQEKLKHRMKELLKSLPNTPESRDILVKDVNRLALAVAEELGMPLSKVISIATEDATEDLSEEKWFRILELNKFDSKCYSNNISKDKSRFLNDEVMFYYKSGKRVFEIIPIMAKRKDLGFKKIAFFRINLDEANAIGEALSEVPYGLWKSILRKSHGDIIKISK